MLMVAYLLAQNVHGPWDNWMGVFFFIALADFLTSVVELAWRGISLVLSWMAN
jgi:hypothetical protein